MLDDGESWCLRSGWWGVVKRAAEEQHAGQSQREHLMSQPDDPAPAARRICSPALSVPKCPRPKAARSKDTAPTSLWSLWGTRGVCRIK